MKIKLGQFFDGVESAVITFWHAAENDKLKKGDSLVEMTADKATFEVPVPCDGTLMRIFKKNGERVNGDEDIAEINPFVA